MTKAKELLILCEENNTSNLTKSLIEMALIANMDESFFETEEGIRDVISGGQKKLKELLSKLGLDVQHSRGLIHILLSAGATMTRLLFHAIKAYVMKDEKSREIVKEIANRKITQDQLYDFLLKLDTATMKVFTGPINMINAITGWRIVPQKIMSEKQQAQGIVHDAIKDIADVIQKVPVLADDLKACVRKIEKNIGSKK